MAEFKVVKLSDEASGSINKILVLGAEDVEQTMHQIEFGNYPIGGTFTPTSTVSDITVAAGTYIDGPIGYVSSSAASADQFLLYMNVR